MDQLVPPSAELMFTFTEYDLGNSLLVSAQEGSLSFTLNTKRGSTGTNGVTTLAVSDANGKTMPGGTIDWNNKTIEVMGVTKPWADVRHKLGGELSPICQWKWSGKKYVTTFKKELWTINLGGETLAVLTPLITHAFMGDELATLTFYLEVPKKEMIFLILAIIFATLKPPSLRCELSYAAQGPASAGGSMNRGPSGKKTQTIAAAAGEVTVGVAAGIAVNAATTAIFGCCAIQ